LTADERGADEDDLDVFRPERPLPRSPEAARRLFGEAGPDHPDAAPFPDAGPGPDPGDGQELPDTQAESGSRSPYGPDDSGPWTQRSPHNRPVPARPLGLPGIASLDCSDVRLTADVSAARCTP
jgi:hypothetical protein